MKISDFSYNKKIHKDWKFPLDLYLEGVDQYRGWFQTSLMINLASYEKIPYKKVITHGFIVDNNKKKMSKSLGNILFSTKLSDILFTYILGKSSSFRALNLKCKDFCLCVEIPINAKK